MNSDIYKLLKWYKRKFKYALDLKNPQTFSEKLQWLKIFDATPLKTQLADKYLVREWIKEKIGEKYLIPLIGVYDKFDDIDFDTLPDRFVLKCNHGSGYNIIVHNKHNIDWSQTKKQVNEWLCENYALKCFEMHYENITPKITIEKYIENKTIGDLYDYKIWCYDGKVKYIQLMSGRHLGNFCEAFYDKNWNKYSFITNHPLAEDLPKPQNLHEMIKIAETLSQGFSFVRVDLYSTEDQKIYFGEMTFTPASGIFRYITKETNIALGKELTLPSQAYNFRTGKYFTPTYEPFWKIRLKYVLSKIGICL